MHPQAAQTGLATRCPGCGTGLVIPPAPAADTAARTPAPKPSAAPGAGRDRSAAAPRAAAPASDQEYGLAPLPEPQLREPLRPVVPVGAAERAPQSDRSMDVPVGGTRLDGRPFAPENWEPPAPPRWPFLSGTFTFPFYLMTLLPWFLMSLGFVLLAEIAALVLMLYQSGQAMYISAGGFLFLGLVWLMAWAASYAAACCTLVVNETAGGADQITDWPLFNFKEWFWALLPVAYLLALAGGLAYLLELLLSPLLSAHGLIGLAGGLLLFPIVWLSALEQDSPFGLVSLPVWRSLVSRPRAWLTFYMLSTATLFLPPLVALWFVVDFPYQVAAIVGIAWSASLLIYARLLGRLGWVISRQGSSTLDEPLGDDEEEYEDDEHDLPLS